MRGSFGQTQTNAHVLLEYNQFSELRQVILDEVSCYYPSTLHSLLYGNTALSDQDNDFIFKAV